MLDDACILYHDNHLLIANKPAGWLTQISERGVIGFQTELAALLEKKLQKKPFLHAVHRLDRPVGGLVLFARSSKALQRLSGMQQVERIYLAELEGHLEQKEGVLEHYLIHGDHRALLGTCKDPKAKLARLSYRVTGHAAATTQVQVKLETGRYHQIRAQMSAIGHPVVGDVLYGARARTEPGIDLRCAYLGFLHPVTQKPVEVKLPFANIVTTSAQFAPH